MSEKSMFFIARVTEYVPNKSKFLCAFQGTPKLFKDISTFCTRSLNTWTMVMIWNLIRIIRWDGSTTCTKVTSELEKYVSKGVFVALKSKSHWYKGYYTTTKYVHKQAKILFKCYIFRLSSSQIDLTIVKRVRVRCTLLLSLFLKLAQISWSTKSHIICPIFLETTKSRI